MTFHHNHNQKAIRFVLIAGALGWVLTGPLARADFQFTPDPGRPGLLRTVNSLDFSAGGDVLLKYDPQNPTRVQAFYQGTLFGSTSSSGPQAGTTMGFSDINRNYQVTVLASITYDVTGVTYYPSSNLIKSATFRVSQSQDPNVSYFRLYADPNSANANSLTGSGFVHGNPIFSATPFSTPDGIANVVATNKDPSGLSPVIVPIDAKGSTEWSQTNTLRFAGSLTSWVKNIQADPSYFPNFPTQTTNPTLATKFTTNFSTPFTLAYPSLAFTGLVNGSLPTDPNVRASVGSINGQFGSDLLLHGDASGITIPNAVPEPSSFALMVVGMVASYYAWRRRPA